MKKYAIIVAGGTGTRMGTSLPKQFLLLKGKPLLWHSIKAFTDAFTDIEIIVVTHKDYIENSTAVIQDFSNKYDIQILHGGDTRFASVKNGLSAVKEPSIVFIHDAVRCLVTPSLIIHCYQQAVEKGSAIPAVTATDSIRVLNNEGYANVVDRNTIKIIQTPQTFQSAIILQAYQQSYQPTFTDEATVAEAAGHTIHLVEGNYDNIKITRPVDLLVAEEMMK